MKINWTSIFVTDQQKALDFYTDKLGFVLKHDIGHGRSPVADRRFSGGAGWGGDRPRTQFAPRGGTLHRGARGRWDPDDQFAVDDVQAEYERLKSLGVTFTQAPATMGPITTAVLDDTVGNLIQLVHQADGA